MTFHNPHLLWLLTRSCRRQAITSTGCGRAERRCASRRWRACSKRRVPFATTCAMPPSCAHGGAGDARSGIGAPPVGGTEHPHQYRRYRHHAGARRIGIDAGARLPPRPPRSGQGGGRIVHLRPLRRPDRTGGLRGRSLHAEPADRRPVDAAHVAGARAAG